MKGDPDQWQPVPRAKRVAVYKCAGCLKGPDKLSSWLCANCVVNGAGSDNEYLRQEYLDRYDPRRGG